MSMPKFFVALILFGFAGLAKAQWRDTKHHLVLSAMAGASYNPGNIEKPQYYQLIGRGMWYWKNRVAFGGDAGFTKSTSQYMNYDAASLNAFAHLKLPLGLYAEAGLGATGVISEGRTARNANAGKYWALGFAKSIGPVAAVEIQYRRAPSLQSDGEKNLNSGLRLGLSFKL